MKIGILTVPFNNNYGGFLQAYALKYVLSREGHEVVFINRRRNRNRTFKFKIKSFVYKLLGFTRYRNSKICEISRNTNMFKDKYLQPITEPYFTTEELRASNQLGLECFIFGSDQVWRYRYAQDSITDFFGGFIENKAIPRFSYAASMGTDTLEFPEHYVNKCSRLLEAFTSVSVREYSSQDLLINYFSVKDVKVVIDPTLLLEKNVYQKLFAEYGKSITRPYIMTYLLDETTSQRNSIDALAKDKALEVIDFKAQTGSITKMKIMEPVEKWLYYIANAEIVITDSFHGTVFSILFNTPFITYYNKKRGLARVKDLLSTFNLLSKMVSNEDSLADINTDYYDWAKVNQVLEHRKEQSMEFLRKSLEKCQSS